MTVRSEKVDVRALLRGEPGDANFTSPKVRMEERARVLAYWHDDIICQIRDGFLAPPPWRLLLDPTSWDDVSKEDVHAVFYAALSCGRWPSLDSLRKRFGRVSNHRGPDEAVGQESLL